jgi:hypothetical protein
MFQQLWLNQWIGGCFLTEKLLQFCSLVCINVKVDLPPVVANAKEALEEYSQWALGDFLDWNIPGI